MNSDFLDLWERDDNDSLAPLSNNQQLFIDKLIDLIKVCEFVRNIFFRQSIFSTFNL